MRSLSELSPSARRIVETKRISGSFYLKGLLRFLAELQNWDESVALRKKTADERLTRAYIGAGVCLTLCILSLDGFWYVGVPLLGAAIGVVVYLTKAKDSLDAIDLPDELRLVVRPLLRQLKQDVDRDRKIWVEFDLNPSGQLFRLRVPTVDGGKAVFSLRNEIQRSDRTRKNARGKSKSKTKWRKDSTLSAALIPSQRIEWSVARSTALIDRQTEKISFSEKNGVVVAKLRKYYKFKNTGTSQSGMATAADGVGMFVRLASLRPVGGGR